MNTMTNLDLELLGKSWALIEPQLHELTSRFYTRLFQAHPEVRPLFRRPIAAQQQHLATALRFAVAHLKKPEVLAPALRAMGARHVEYGVKPEQYDVVGEVLLASLADVSGEAWSQEVEEAWARAYRALASLCLEGDRAAREKPSPVMA